MNATAPGVLISRNPANGSELGSIQTTPAEEVGPIVASARSAQAQWGALAWKERRKYLERWWRILAADSPASAGSIVAEVGKPLGEAMAEMAMGLDGVRWTVRHGGAALRDERIRPHWQRVLGMSNTTLRHQPIGVVAILGTWNYPFFLNAPAIAAALAAGNSVVWKPSELAPLCGEWLQRSLHEAGFPEGVVQSVSGGPEVGEALIAADIDKAMFTGGVESGRRVLSALAGRGIPAVAELSGFDPAIVLPDAPLDSTVRSLCWAAFVASGQACVATKRIYVVGDPQPWINALLEHARALRVGNPADESVDIGPLVSESARARCDAKVRAAIAAGAEVILGAECLPGPGWFYSPTILSASGHEPESALAGIFGPVVLVRGVSSVDEAVAAANRGQYGLGASVWGQDRRAAALVAARIQAGMVSVNDAVTPAGNASAPFGGTKASGFGRTHGTLGLREFTQPHAVQVRGAGGLRPNLFPYSGRIVRLLSWYIRLFHGGRGARHR